MRISDWSSDVCSSDLACLGLSDAQRTALRRRAIGFVYQYHHLLPEFSALENVALPQMIAGVAKSKARSKAAALLARSEERRVGKECVSMCRSRWSPDHEKKKKKQNRKRK